MKTKLALSILLGIFLISLASALTSITTCDTILSIENEKYQIANDLYGNRTCLNITANGIILDGQGFTINYTGNATSIVGYGIFCNSSNITIKNTIFKEGKALGNFKYAFLSRANSSNITFYNNSFYTLGTGSISINIPNYNDVDIQNNTFNQGGSSSHGINGSGSNYLINNNLFNLKANTGLTSSVALNNLTLTNNLFNITANNGLEANMVAANSLIENNICNNSGTNSACGQFTLVNSTLRFNNFTAQTAVATGFGLINSSVYNNTFRGNGMTSTNIGTSGWMYNNDVITGGSGLNLASFNIDIFNNSFVGSANGLTVSGSSNRVYNNYIQAGGTSNGINMGNCNSNIFTNNWIVQTGTGNLGVIFMQSNQYNNSYIGNYVEPSGTATSCFHLYAALLNTTLKDNICNKSATKDSITFRTAATLQHQYLNVTNLTLPNGSNGISYTLAGLLSTDVHIWVNWYLQAQVNDSSGNPLSGYNISASNNVTGQVAFSNLTTNADGYSIPYPVLYSYENASEIGNVTYYSYNVSAQSGENINYSFTTPSFNTIVNFVFASDYCWSRTGNLLFIPEDCLYSSLEAILDRIFG